MSNPIGISFLTPTDKDKFTEEKQNKNMYRILFGKSLMDVILQKKEGGVSFSIHSEQIWNDYDRKKLMGYIHFKLLAKAE
jgi:hypothetical protein